MDRLPPSRSRLDPIDIFIVDVTGNQTRQLTRGEGSNEDPSWSPDGRFLAFVSTRNSRPELFIMDADGSAPHRLVEIPGRSTPHWSRWRPSPHPSPRFSCCPPVPGPLKNWCRQGPASRPAVGGWSRPEKAAADAAPSDLDVRPSRWDTRMALPEAERLLREPLTLPASARLWRDQLRRSEDPCGLLVPGSEPFAAPPIKRPGKGSVPQALERIVNSMSMARGSVAKAVSSRTPDERRTTLQEVRGIVTNKTGPRSDPAVYDSMARFDQAAMATAGRDLCRAVWQELPVLLKAAGKQGLKEKRWELPFGDGLMVGPGERTFKADELKGVAPHPPRRQERLPGPVAAAGEARSRWSSTSRPVWSGNPTPAAHLRHRPVFLPNAAGTKRISGGDFSLGAGAFGVGGLFIEGTGNVLEGGRFTEGAGAFGAGLLWSRGESAVFRADLSGQGYGFTRGSGIFSHRGSKADLRCGLRYPDPREASASLSLCQGAGYGHRAFAGGGLAYLKANDSS